MSVNETKGTLPHPSYPISETLLQQKSKDVYFESCLIPNAREKKLHCGLYFHPHTDTQTLLCQAASFTVCLSCVCFTGNTSWIPATTTRWEKTCSRNAEKDVRAEPARHDSGQKKSQFAYVNVLFFCCVAGERWGGSSDSQGSNWTHQTANALPASGEKMWTNQELK